MDEQAPNARPFLATTVLGLAVIACARLLDAEPLYVPGVAFLTVSAGAVLWVLGGAHGVRVERTVGARRVVEDQPVAVELRVVSPRPLPTGSVVDDLLPEPAPLAAGRRVTRVRIRVRFGGRGRKVLAPPSVVVRDPFGLLTRVRRGGAAAEVLVLPRVERVGAPRDGGDGSSGMVSRGRPAVAAEAEVDGLRRQRPGTPASSIFWPSLARGGELLERRLSAESDTRPLILLDPRGAESDDDLDAAVRAMASLALHFARSAGCLLAVPGDRRPTHLDATLAGWARVHARLALVHGGQAPALGGLAGRRGPVIYVAARRIARPPRALAHAPAVSRMLVVPGTLAGRRAAFFVAGCHGYELSGARALRGARVA